MTTSADPVAAFIEAACVPLDQHASGTLDEAEAILATHPEVAASSIHTAAILGDDAAVRHFLEVDPGDAIAKGGPRGWDALTHLCFSRYLRLDRARSAGFVRAAEALLDAGASANTGFYSGDDYESAIYGAAGIARDPELTRLLLERGADPNDDETPYHTPETYDNRAMEVLVESGKLNEDSMTTLLHRKFDWHDHDGVAWLLERGADPNRVSRWKRTALQHALLRDNHPAIIELLLDRGADPRPAVSIAARRGRADVLAAMERRGIAIDLEGADRLIAACARGDDAVIAAESQVRDDVRAEGGQLLAEFAGNGNADGVGHLLDLGIDAGTLFRDGDGYWNVAKNSTALHVAAWRAQHAVVRLLLQRGAPVGARDGQGRTPLALAVRACVDSYWTRRRSPESVEALLRAGASLDGVKFPSGYDEVDDLLRRAGATS